MEGIVTEFIPNKRFAVHLESKIHTVDASFQLEEKGDGTELTQNADIKFKGIMRVLILFLQGSIRKKINSQTQREFARLKELCEQESQSA